MLVYNILVLNTDYFAATLAVLDMGRVAINLLNANQYISPIQLAEMAVQMIRNQSDPRHWSQWPSLSTSLAFTSQPASSVPILVMEKITEEDLLSIKYKAMRTVLSLSSI